MAFNFPAQFLDEIHETWSDLVAWLEAHREFLTTNMQAFVRNMATQKRQPSIGQLALIVSLVCSIQFRFALEEHARNKAEVEAPENLEADNVVDLTRYRRKAG